MIQIKETNRIEYFDFLKGIAIIGVIAIHISDRCYVGGSSDYRFWLEVSWRQIVNFSVPLFLAISGYLLANKEFHSIKDYLSFLKKQTIKVLVPYFSWSIFFLLLFGNENDTIIRTTLKIMSFQSSGIFYYIFLIIQFYVLLPVFQKIKSFNQLLLILFVNIVFVFAFSHGMKYFSLPFIFSAGIFPTWIIFFSLGVYLKNNIIKTKNASIALLTVLFLFLSILETFFLYQQSGSIGSAVSPIKTTSLLFACLIIIISIRNKDRVFKTSTFLAPLGKVSLGIYFIHLIVLHFYTKLLSVINLNLANNVLVYQIISILSVVAISYLTIYYSKKINYQLFSKCLGF